MKFAVNFFLIVFISFLAMPTIVTLIEEKVNVTAFYSTSEEEIQKEVKELKLVLKEYCFQGILQFEFNSNIKIFNENQSNLDLISRDILIPPPKLS